MADDWNGPARVFHPDDECPLCHVKGKCALASEFKMMGSHRFRACVACGKASDNGKEKGEVTSHIKEA